MVSADGEEIASFESSKDFQALIYSSSAIESGESYTISTGGSVSGDGVGGLRKAGSLDGATEALTVTAGERTGGMGGGMGGGGPQGEAPGDEQP